jgi:hypothetical protein
MPLIAGKLGEVSVAESAVSGGWGMMKKRWPCLQVKQMAQVSTHLPVSEWLPQDGQ